MVIQERYTPLPVAANSTVIIYGDNVGGFLCTTSGTITLVSNAHDGKVQTTIVNAMSVTAGIWYPLPFFIGTGVEGVSLAFSASNSARIACSRRSASRASRVSLSIRS